MTLTLQQKTEDRPFNPWRKFTEDAKPFLRMLAMFLEAQRGKKNRRNPQDQHRYEQLLEAVVADLAHNALLNEPVAIHLSRNQNELSKQFNRNYNPAFLNGTMLPDILDALKALFMIEMTKGHCGPPRKDGRTVKQTRITAGTTFIDLLKNHRVKIGQIESQYEGREILMLKGNAEGDEGFSPVGHERDNRHLVDYEDTETSRAYRQEVVSINQWLSHAPLTIVGDVTVDIRERQLRRHFSRSSFESGGRLFGGFWQPMHKVDRFPSLRIDGREIVEHDYKTMMPRLLYGHTKQSIPPTMTEDLYRIPGYERSRAGIKKLFSAMLFDLPGKVRNTFPNHDRTGFHLDDLQRAGGKVGPIIEAIKTAHRPVAEHFGTGLGYYLMFLESQILIAVLLELFNRGVYTLPLHDAVLVSKGKEAAHAQLVMLKIFERIAGIPGKLETHTN